MDQGTVLHERYRILRPIGKGGMGAVYEAIDLRLHHSVAVKRMTATGGEAQRAFMQEAQLLASLRHAGLPSVTDYFVDGDTPFLVMQYIEGENLEQIRRRHGGSCARADVLGWAADLLKILAFLHRHDPQVVHRDVKPSNIKLTPDGEIVLVDFGLAKSSDLGTTHVADADEPRSVYGFTPNYAPPEQHDGSGTDARSDLYAVGATLYHLLTGVTPAAADARVAALASGAPDPLPLPHIVNRGVGAALGLVVMRALSVSVHDRFQTAEELMAALKALPSLDHQEARGREVSDERRVDAAMPSEAPVGRPVDLMVQVRFASSPLLGLEDWPGKRVPDSIEQASDMLQVKYPIDQDTGRELPARLRVKIVTPDFTISGSAECLFEVPPSAYSQRLSFLLTAQRAGPCRLHVELYDDDSLRLGTVPLDVDATAAASAPTQPVVRVAHLVLRMMSRDVAKDERPPLVASRPRIPVAQPRPPLADAASLPGSTKAGSIASSRTPHASPKSHAPLAAPRMSRWMAVAAPLAVLVIGVVVWQSRPAPEHAAVVASNPPTSGTPTAAPPSNQPPTASAPSPAPPTGVIEGGGVGRRIIPGTQALEDAARQDILAVLERYRRANEARDFAAIQQVWPGVNTNVRGTLNDVSAIQLTFLGEPAIDLQLAGGMARVAVPMRIVEVRGSDKRARDTIATISLSNVNASRQWVITGVTHKPAE